MGLIDKVGAMSTKLSTLDTSIDAVTTALNGITARALPNKVPSATTAFTAVNALPITTTTGVTVKTGTAAKRMYITQALAFNKTTTEDNGYLLYEATTASKVLAVLPGQDADALTAPAQMITFCPPIKTNAGKDIKCKGIIATQGDTYCFINGYIET